MSLDTTIEYKCTMCGSGDIQTIRQDRENPRLKCKSCQFTFNGKDAIEAEASGAIQASSPETLAAAVEPQPVDYGLRDGAKYAMRVIPKTPAYVFIDKKSHQVEFCTKKDFKKTAINWSPSDFNVYELKPIKLNVKVDVSSRSSRMSS